MFYGGLVAFAVSVVTFIVGAGCERFIWHLLWTVVSVGASLASIGLFNEAADFADCGLIGLIDRILQIASVIVLILSVVFFLIALF